VTPEAAYQLFSRPRRMKVASIGGEVPVADAKPFSFRFRDRLLKGLIFGETGKTILLVHGWESRGAHLQQLVSPLRHAGFRVVSFDAPAHGESEGDQTHVGEFGQVVLMLPQVIGEIDGVIAHSAGSPAVLYAVSQGLQIDASVHIAGPFSFERVLERHAALCGLDVAGYNAFRELVLGDLGFDPALLDEQALSQHLAHHGLLIHDLDDKEVPVNESHRLLGSWRNAVLETVEGLGHRRIIKDKGVVKSVVSFLQHRLLPIADADQSRLDDPVPA
jgi:predicted alpha/beta hydrolase family esterase